MEEYEYHIQRAKRSYLAFKLLKSRKLLEDALSRGYYAILHIGFALLLKNNLNLPKTHAGLVVKLWSNREKLNLDKEIIKQISRFQVLRESGDYAAIPAVEKKDIDSIEKVIKKLFTVLGEDV
ncbi:MAG: HEPN domain-containing protein [Candidatus Heimdallarchaeaceae archaeon]